MARRGRPVMAEHLRRSAEGSFNISIDGANEIARDLSLLSQELRDLRPAWGLLWPRLLTGVRNIVASRGALVGHNWPREYRPKYGRRKAREGFGSEHLRRTGALMDSLRVLAFKPLSMRFGTKLRYARAMNFGYWNTPGGGRRKQDIRPRPFLFSAGGGTSEEIRRAAHEEISRYVDVLLGRMRAMKAAT